MSDDQSGGAGGAGGAPKITTTGRDIPVRITATTQKFKSRKQYEELVRSGRVKKAVIIALVNETGFPGDEGAGAGYHVLGQGMTLDEIGDALLAGAHGVSHAAERQRAMSFVPGAVGAVTSETWTPPSREAELGPQPVTKKKPNELRRRPNGEIDSPPGQHWVACGECGNGTHMVCETNDTNVTTFLVCSRCGNEIKKLRVGVDIPQHGGRA